MAWIKFEKDLLTDPRVLRMAKNIGNLWRLVQGENEFLGTGFPLPAVTLVVGGLVRLWCLADTHVDEEDVLPLGCGEIDELVGICGFCSQMPPEWLMPIDEKNTRLPNFHAHNGTEAKTRAVTQKRVARHREALQRRNGRALPDQTRPDQTKTKEEEVAVLPPWLPLEAWKSWLEVRKKKKVPNTARALNLAADELERLKSQGFDPQAVINQSVLKGWTSFYPLKDGLPATEPAGKLCDYCEAVSSGTVNGRRACDKHWPRAMSNESPAKQAMELVGERRMLGVVPKPVAGRD